MKKFLRFLGVLLLLIVIAWAILAFVEPKDVTVSRSLTMNASKDVVWDQIVKFKNWPNWSPWQKMDSTAKMDYQGTDGQPGSSFHWVGPKTGEGTMTNTSSDNGVMKYDLNFVKPHEGKADGWFKVDDSGAGKVNVTWSVHMHMGFPMNAMLAFMDMDKMMGKDFETGLKNIKEYTEAHSTMQSAVDIKETQFAGGIYCGVRKVVGWKDLSKYFMDTYGMLGPALQARIIGPSAGLYWTWDTVKHETDMAAVFPVKDSTKPVKGATFFNVKPSSACMVVHNGPYSSMGNDHMALMKYCADKSMKVSLVVEEYLVGPGGPKGEKDSTKWVTNIYYLCDNMTSMKK